MMFVGDQGKILADFRGENPRIISGRKSASEARAKADDATRSRDRRARAASWVAAFKGGPATYGDFLLAGPISDAFNLGAVSLRMGGRRLRFDSASAKVTNVAEANKLLTREYRPGWEL